MEIYGILKPTGIEIGEYNKKHLADYARKNGQSRVKISVLTPESASQRRFFEGAVVPIITFFQEGLDHRNWKDNKDVRAWLELEFLPELVIVHGKIHRTSQSSKGQLKKLIEECTDWLVENYAIDPDEVLNPSKYEDWRDSFFLLGAGPDNYIDYLVETGKLKKP